MVLRRGRAKSGRDKIRKREKKEPKGEIRERERERTQTTVIRKSFLQANQTPEPRIVTIIPVVNHLSTPAVTVFQTNRRSALQLPNMQMWKGKG